MMRTCSHSEPRTVTCSGLPGHSQSEHYYLHFADGETEAHRGADSHSWERWRLKFLACLGDGDEPGRACRPHDEGELRPDKDTQGEFCRAGAYGVSGIGQRMLEEAHTLPSKSGKNPCGGIGGEG